MTVVALVLAAGQGTRLGRGRPKGLLALRGRPLFEWSARALARSPVVDALQLVLPPDALEAARGLAADWSEPARLLEPVAGGETRQDSVVRGLAGARTALPAAVWVLVHDAARCLVEPDDAGRVLDAARQTGAALPVVPPGDTVKLLDGARVEQTLGRERVGLAQTPQAFRVAILREALEKAERDGFSGTDCASLVERLGVEVRVCDGRPGNWKITLPQDLERAEIWLAERGEPA